MRDVDAEVSEGRDGVWVKRSGMCASTEDLEAISSEVTQQAFCHLAASGISGTED
jgi:hypothetical protein